MMNRIIINRMFTKVAMIMNNAVLPFFPISVHLLLQK